ncbi:hypothetical protein [Nocardioides sp. KR10-350]|uniref:hypothetical protein n=1 Tax=Nocardioides cheoyonin TaxID=3156615 RepID=UPI0032B350F4
MPATPTVLGIGAGQISDEPQRRGPIGLPSQVKGPRYDDLGREGSHELSPLVRVVPGFMTAEQGAPTSWRVLADALKAQSTAVFADLGRIHSGSPSMPIVTAADAIIPVCRGDQVSVQTMTKRVELLVDAFAERNQRPPAVVPVVIANRKHGDAIAQMVAQILADSAAGAAVRSVAWVAWDPAGVAALDNGGDPWAKPLRNSPLMRSARKAMWHLGMATGLDHTEPNVKGKRVRDAAEQPTHHAIPTQVPPPAPNGAPQQTWAREAAASEPGSWQVSPMGEEH